MYEEKSKRIIIWDGGSIRLSFNYLLAPISFLQSLYAAPKHHTSCILRNLMFESFDAAEVPKSNEGPPRRRFKKKTTLKMLTDSSGKLEWDFHP